MSGYRRSLDRNLDLSHAYDSFLQIIATASLHDTLYKSLQSMPTLLGALCLNQLLPGDASQRRGLLSARISRLRSSLSGHYPTLLACLNLLNLLEVIFDR
jgi:hypothetical protein